MRKRQLLLKAFKKLEKKGLIARANFMCCTTCASNGVAWDAEITGVKGGVYWHAQDEESLGQRNELHIGFAAAGFDSGNTAEVGKILAETLTEEGLDVIWDGDPNKKVLVRRGGKR
ncbi:MAG: hypothetical protein ACE5JQ_00670 [Candidatus Methylomirabilales bacterium]